ncbi:hypothetical protein C8R43DRAFT_1092322 [Mycena crocata]|nr:hypothetical protein C8R43DRAFT_1092322 [Mycena crocata]
MPEKIAAWILDGCDSIKLDGTTRNPTEVRLSFTNAQKMRAAASWNFGQVANQGNKPWANSNPSVSRLVSQYITSLRRRKVQAGEIAVSARALTPDILERLYDFNNEQGRSIPKPYGSEKLKKWEGARARLLTWAAYLIAFTCLLRADEVTKIQAHDIRKHPTKDDCIIVTLPFRKTAQFGEIQPFYLYLLPEEEAHLCPVRAYWAWTAASEIKDGYLFRKIGANDRILPAGDFLEIFRNHLLDIGVDSYPYGTHSFRRGGCQYLHVYRRWLIRDICQWGGWSIEFSSLTIVKYLISSSDNPRVLREDFFNPNRPLQLKCPYCGRSCHCA